MSRRQRCICDGRAVSGWLHGGMNGMATFGARVRSTGKTTLLFTYIDGYSAPDYAVTVGRSKDSSIESGSTSASTWIMPVSLSKLLPVTRIAE